MKMTLCTNLADLSQTAIDDDLQSITGIWLRGFSTDFSQVLQKIQEYVDVEKKADKNAGEYQGGKPWTKIYDALQLAYGGIAYSDAGGASLSPTEQTESDELRRVAQLLSIDRRDYNYFNKLLGFGARHESLQTILTGEGWRFGLSTNILEVLLEDENFLRQYCELINIARNGKRGPEVAWPVNKAKEPIDNKRKPADSKAVDAIVNDNGDSKLFLKLDLSEWIYINNPDILHVVIESPQSLNGFYPLGRTTVWLPAQAQVQHVRSKTAKTFLRGQIAQRLRIEDLESNLAGFVNTIFDTDSEQAYSSASGPC
jgi:hypothetical protein